jgi:hypothetical protein
MPGTKLLRLQISFFGKDEFDLARQIEEGMRRGDGSSPVLASRKPIGIGRDAPAEYQRPLNPTHT